MDENKNNNLVGDAEVIEEKNNSNGDFVENNNKINYTNFDEESKNRKDIRRLTLLIVVLFIICFAVLGWSILKDDNKTTTSKESKVNNNTNVELKYTETTNTSKEGVYLIDVSEIVDNVMPSIVSITSKTLVNSGHYGPGFYNNDEKNYATGAGSGIIVSKSDTELMILTNKHVIEDADALSVTFINDKSVDAKVKGASTSRDIAIISIPLSSMDEETLKSIKIATMGKSTDLKVGQGVIAIGNALGYGQSVTTGVISALDREVSIDNSTSKMIQIDAAINGGNSGGALLNSKGEVIGINSAKYSSSGISSSASIEGMGFAIPISDVTDLITNIMNGTSLTEEEKGYLGVSGYMITEDYSSVYGMPVGFYINDIVKNSGADKAKLEIGNIITKIEGKEVTSFNVISEVLEMKKAGEEVTITIKYTSGREYKEKEVKVKLSSYKDVN